MPSADALTHLDDAICLWLTDHTNGHPCNSPHLNALAAPLTRPGRESWRLIDRRLQALRESGRISYVGKRKQDHGWRVSCPAAKQPSS
jgi:hypothetical protein